MIYVAETLITLFLLSAQIFAYSDDAILSSLDACTFGAGITFSKGVSAVFYSPTDASAVLSSSGFYVSGYTDESSITTGELSEFTISVNGGIGTIGNVVLANSGTFVAQLGGYFYGKFFFIIFLLLCQ